MSYRQGNARELQFVKELLTERWDAIVDFMVYTTEEFRERVHLLLESTKQYLFLSSARVFAASKDPLTESSARLKDVIADEEYLLSDEYALSKARQEDLLKSSGCNWTIIRPYITYDENRLQLGVMEKEGWLYRAMKGRSIVVSKELLSHFTTLTYGGDVADSIVSLIGNPAAQTESYNITCAVNVQWTDVLDNYVKTLSAILHRPVKVVVTQDEMYIKYGAKYQVLYDRFYDRVFDNSKLLQSIPQKQFTGWRSGLSSCIRTFVEKPNFGFINWAMEARKDRVAGEFTSLSEIPGVKNKIKYLICRFTNR